MEILDNQQSHFSKITTERARLSLFYYSTPYYLIKYRPIKCVDIIYGYAANGYKGSEQLFARI